MTNVRDWSGRLMRRVGLHGLSGWWDAGTDHRSIKRAERDRLSGYDRRTGMYLKGGLRARNAPEPTGHPRPPKPPIRTAWEYAALCLAGGPCGDPDDNGNLGPAMSDQDPRACWNCERGREVMRAIYGDLPTVTYRPGWEFRWSCANGHLFLHCIVGEPDAKGWDAVTGERRGSGDWMWVTELPLDPKWLLGKIAQMENHERREWFKVDGQPPCWPHGGAGREQVRFPNEH